MNNKLKKISILLVYIILIAIIFITSINNKKVQIKIKYNSNCENEVSQLFFDIGNGYSEENSSKSIIKNDYSILDIDKKYYNFNTIRLDPITNSKQVEIESIEFIVSGNRNKTITASEFKDHIIKTDNIENIISKDDGSIVINPSGSDMQIYLDNDFTILFRNIDKQNLVLKIVFLALVTIAFICILCKFNIGRALLKQKNIIILSFCILLFLFNVYQWFNSKVLYNDIYIMRTIFLFILYSIILFFYKKGWENGWNIIFNNRYKICLGLFLFCIVFKLNGSSIAFWNNFISDGNNSTGTILGIPRAIRSDEWAVRTPMGLSQYYNNFGYFSNIIRASKSDMFIVCDEAVRDIAIIFRPFHWGYLFLSPERGLSFFWYGRLIALFITTFEFGMIITKNKKDLSLLLSILVSLAPAVQWWFDVNGLIGTIIFGELGIIMIDKYISCKKHFNKIIYASVLCICACGYILVFYPAWQIPFMYIFLAIFIAIILERYKDIQITHKDILIFLVPFLISVAIMIHVLVNSKDTLQIVMNTVYPGKRFEYGGETIESMVKYVINIFLPYTKTAKLANACEESVFIDFFPIGLILALYNIFVKKSKDKMLKCLLVSNIILILWCLFSWPDIIAKYSLLSNSPALRTIIPLGYLNILILVRSLSDSEYILSRKKSIFTSIVIAGILELAAKSVYKGYINKIMFLCSFIIFTICFIGLMNFSNKKVRKALIPFITIIMFISGATVNPVQKGLNVIYNNKLVNQINNINCSNNGTWIVEGLGFPFNNLPIMAGAPVINSTNSYPNLDRWRMINSSEECEKIYNRYAHINIDLQNDQKTKFTLLQSDVFKIDLNINDLSILGVKYILTKNDLDRFSNKNIHFENIYSDNGYKIYKIV